MVILGNEGRQRFPPLFNMRVEFSPSQLLAPQASTQVNGEATPPALTASTPLQGTAELQSKLSDLPLTRPDKMDAAQQLVSSVSYPPGEIFNGIAHLLAMHLTN